MSTDKALGPIRVDQLFSDCYNTFNRTGKTPSQLAERLEEAEELARLFLAEFEDVLADTPIAYYKVERAAKKFLNIPNEDTNG